MIECGYCHQWFDAPNELKTHIEGHSTPFSHFRGNSFRCSCCSCGDIFERAASELAKNNYCSTKCSHGANLEKSRAEAYKLQALLRDDFTCQECGLSGPKHIEEYNQLPHVHHKESDGGLKDMGRLETLCQNCHSQSDKSTI